MKTIQITLDEALLLELDTIVEQIGISREAFMRSALIFALKKHRIRQMEEQHRRGYEEIPQEDMSEWIAAQAWDDIC